MKGNTMKGNAKILIAVALLASLAAGSAFATGAIKLPDEVKSSSVKLPRGVESQAQFAKHARVSQQQAEAAALAVRPGKVVKAKLDDGHGYLVWQIDVKHGRGTTEIAFDAGNSQVLAAEAETHDDHAGREHEDRNERS
jgi:hypothetical protein